MAKSVPASFVPLDLKNFQRDVIITESDGATLTYGGSLQRIGQNINWMYRHLGMTSHIRMLSPLSTSATSATLLCTFPVRFNLGMINAKFSFAYSATFNGAVYCYLKIELVGSSTTSATTNILSASGAIEYSTAASVALPTGTQETYTCNIYGWRDATGPTISFYGLDLYTPTADTTNIGQGDLSETGGEGSFEGHDAADLQDIKPVPVWILKRMHQNMLFFQKDYRQVLAMQFFNPPLQALRPNDPTKELDGGGEYPDNTRLVARIPISPRRNLGFVTYKLVHSNPYWDTGNASSQYSTSIDVRNCYVKSMATGDENMHAGSVLTIDDQTVTDQIAVSTTGGDVIEIRCGKLGAADTNGGSYGGLKIKSILIYEDSTV